LLAAIFDDRCYFESLCMEPYYAYTAAQVPEARQFLEQLIADTRSRRYTLVHGDYSPKNILVHDGRLILLDHEVIHWGDAAFDIGFALTHLLSKAHHLSEHRDAFARAGHLFVETYQAAVDAEIGTMGARHTLACLLARVAGRSPLEYLDDAERQRQRRIVTNLMQCCPRAPGELIDSFTKALNGGD